MHGKTKRACRKNRGGLRMGNTRRTTWSHHRITGNYTFGFVPSPPAVYSRARVIRKYASDHSARLSAMLVLSASLPISSAATTHGMIVQVFPYFFFPPNPEKKARGPLCVSSLALGLILAGTKGKVNGEEENFSLMHQD